MSGTKLGGIKAAETNKTRYGKDFYIEIGSKGGLKTGIKKGFAENLDRAREAGRKGGKKSRRTRNVSK
jgi:general stress protein YciG